MLKLLEDTLRSRSRSHNILTFFIYQPNLFNPNTNIKIVEILIDKEKVKGINISIGI